MFKNNARAIILFAICLTVIGTCAGCAGGRRGTSDSSRQESFRIDRKRYVPLRDFCATNGLSWEWDGFTRIITVHNRAITVKLYPGSALALHNSSVVRLDGPVRMYKGMITVPESFARLFGREQPPVAARPEKRPGKTMLARVVIDAGHGGKDPGAVGVGGIHEKEIVLDIAQRLARELERQDIDVTLTRQTDIFHPLATRSDIANNANADFFISVHANASESSSANGFEAYYLAPEYDDFAKAVQIRENAVVKYEEDTAYAQSNDLNATLWDMLLSENRIESIAMANTIAGELRRIVHLRTRYVKGAQFYVLKGAQMPAVLLEVGYLTNPTEARQLSNPYYRQMIAEAVAAGVIRYKSEFELNEGFTR